MILIDEEKTSLEPLATRQVSSNNPHAGGRDLQAKTYIFLPYVRIFLHVLNNFLHTNVKIIVNILLNAE